MSFELDANIPENTFEAAVIAAAVSEETSNTSTDSDVVGSEDIAVTDSKSGVVGRDNGFPITPAEGEPIAPAEGEPIAPVEEKSVVSDPIPTPAPIETPSNPEPELQPEPVSYSTEIPSGIYSYDLETEVSELPKKYLTLNDYLISINKPPINVESYNVPPQKTQPLPKPRRIIPGPPRKMSARQQKQSLGWKLKF